MCTHIYIRIYLYMHVVLCLSLYNSTENFLECMRAPTYVPKHVGLEVFIHSHRNFYISIYYMHTQVK